MPFQRTLLLEIVLNKGGNDVKKAYCRSCTYSIERFTSAFAGKVYGQMVALIRSKSLKADVLFVGL